MDQKVCCILRNQLRVTQQQEGRAYLGVQAEKPDLSKLLQLLHQALQEEKGN